MRGKWLSSCWGLALPLADPAPLLENSHGFYSPAELRDHAPKSSEFDEKPIALSPAQMALQASFIRLAALCARRPPEAVPPTMCLSSLSFKTSNCWF